MNRLPPEDHLGRPPSELLGEMGERIEGLLREVARPASRWSARSRRGRRPPALPRGHGVPGPRARRRGHRARGRHPRRHRASRGRGRARPPAQGRAVRPRPGRGRAGARRGRARRAASARRRTEFLARAGERLAVVTRDYESTLQEVANVAVPTIADWCVFTLVEPRGALRPSRSRRPTRPTGARRAFRRPLPAAARRRRRRRRTSCALAEPEVVNDVRRDAARGDRRGRRAPRAAAEPRAALGHDRAAARRGDRIIGALSLVFSRSGRSFTDDDVALAESLAGRAALAVENARLYAERSHIAQTLQRSLLPPALPDIDGPRWPRASARPASRTRSAATSTTPSARPTASGRCVIGDVSGKGPKRRRSRR